MRRTAKNFKFLILGISSFVITPLLAQETETFSKVEIGAEGGPSSISLYGNETLAENRKFDVGVMGGLTVQFNLNKSLALKTGLYYEKKGTKTFTEYFPNNFVGYNTVLSEFSYVTLPLLLKVNLDKNQKFFINAGPYISYLFEMKQISNWPAFYGDYYETSEISDYNRLDYGLSMGAGISLPICNGIRFNAEVRDNLGLYNINASESSSAETIKNNSLNLILGFSYGFKPN